LQLLDEQDFDAILIDYNLGERTGLDLATTVMQRGFRGPTIMLTGHGDYAIDVEAMKAGVSEYLSKRETTPLLLERTIRYAIEHRRSLEALRQANEQLGKARDELEGRVQERTAELQNILRRVEALAQISQALAQLGRDLPGVMETVSRYVVEWIGDTCSISLVSPDGDYLQHHSVYHPNPEAHALFQSAINQGASPIETGLADKVAQTGEPLLIPVVNLDEIAGLSPGLTEYIERFGVSSILVVPMRAQDRIVGTLGVSRSQPGRPYTSEDSAFLQDIADRTGLAIENARLFSLAEQELGERQRAELELRKSQAQFERLFESAPDSTLLLDQDGIIQKANQQTIQVFGHSLEELLGQRFTLLLPDRFHPNFQNFLAAALNQRDGLPLRMEKDIAGCRKNQEEFPIELLQAPIRLADSAGFICVIHDITGRKKMEAELAEVPRRLFESVEAERIRLAKELHDGPIQEMYGIAFGLRSISGELNSDDFRTMMRIEEMLKRLYATIQTMRDISRLLRPPTLSPFGLEKTIRSHVESFREQHPEIDVQLDLDQDALELSETVRLVLYRIFQNALSNITRHAQATQVIVRLKLRTDQVVLEVQDNGLGFDFQGRWIDLVRQGHMGLAGSNERAEAIGARLDILTAPGEGALLRVTAPLTLHEAPA
jgi:PAS domain S-box-containing protein